jgi:hypothetical protein
VDFLVKDKGFKCVVWFMFISYYVGLTRNSEDRVRKGADKLTKFLNAKQQGRLDGFFTLKAKEKEPAPAAKGKGKGAKEGKGGKEDGKKGSKRKVRVRLVDLSPMLTSLQADEMGAGGSKKKTKK